ncbi:Man1-Src1p-C-terminal domain-containing protein [Chytriomyces sp. MP71]|nr:Man1-Src1p-C-terminal domain-containing protein [Chytriomyces sp. MP71]
MASGMNDRSGRATTLSRPITSTATSKQTKKRASSAAKTDSKPFTFPSKFLSVASGLIALLAALAYASVFVIFWDQIGYRERGTPATVFPVTGNEGIDTLIRLAMPGLSKECPAGAVCFGKVVDGCEEPDHVIQYGALSRLVGPYLPKGWQFVVPFAGEPVCVEDKARLQLEAKKQTQVENLVAYLNDIVRKWTGSMLCGEANPDPDMTNLELSIIRDPKTRSLIGMPASSGKRQLRALVGTKWSDEKFEEYWNLVLFRLASHAAAGGQDPSHPPIPLRTVVDSATGRHRLLTTTSAPLLSFTCQARNTLWQAATRYYPHLLLSAFLLATLVVLNIRRAAAARDAHVAATLVEDILDALHAESENHRRDPLRHPVPGLALNALRDHFLRVCKTGGAGLDAYGFAAELDDAARTRWRVSDARVRDKVWGVVRAAVLRNACVRETVMEVGGEEDCVWQWIGSFALSPKKRKMVGERRQSGMVDASGDSVESRAALSKSKQAGGEDIVDVKKELFKQGEQGTRSSGNINYPSL